jgi:phenylpyruvate tautomerase PptA (4-oxalocrotonate tautomerase family)
MAARNTKLHQERIMPTYTVTSASLALTTEQEAVIAAVITHLYHENTGAPAYFAWSIFSTIENGKHYIGGKTYRTVHLFCLGWSAPAAARMPKAGLITDIATKVQTIASIAGGYPGLHQDIPQRR